MKCRTVCVNETDGENRKEICSVKPRQPWQEKADNGDQRGKEVSVGGVRQERQAKENCFIE